MTALLIEITLIGGNCPVQAEGTVNGVPFYFRARGKRWSMSIGGQPVGDPAWYYEEAYGDDYEAGWMPVEMAETFLRLAARRWLDEGAPSVKRAAE